MCAGFHRVLPWGVSSQSLEVQRSSDVLNGSDAGLHYIAAPFADTRMHRGAHDAAGAADRPQVAGGVGSALLQACRPTQAVTPQALRAH